LLEMGTAREMFAGHGTSRHRRSTLAECSCERCRGRTQHELLARRCRVTCENQSPKNGGTIGGTPIREIDASARVGREFAKSISGLPTAVWRHLKTAKTYTFSYTYTGETGNIIMITDRCDIYNPTQKSGTYRE